MTGFSQLLVPAAFSTPFTSLQCKTPLSLHAFSSTLCIQSEMNEDIQDWLEQSLIEEERSRSIVRVRSVRKSEAVGKGDNYASEMCRLHAELVLGSGRRLQRSFIYKTFPTSEFRRKHLKSGGLFVKEIRMYKEVLPFMESIRLERETGEPIWGRTLATKGYETLLLEDLSEHGYKMGERRKGLDLAHCSLVVRSLAKFHALSAILKEKGDFLVQDFEKHYFEVESELIGKFYKVGLHQLADSMENKWEGNWKEDAECLRKIAANIEELLTESFRRDDSMFNALNHGDCWVNNVMFRYGADGEPTHVRLIDFQLSFYNSVGFDLQYFLNTSPNLDVRENQIDNLLHEYHQTLVSELELHGYSGSSPSFDDLQIALKKTALFGLTTAVGLLPLLLLPPADAPDLEKILENHNKTQEMNPAFFQHDNQLYVETMQLLIVRARKIGLLDQ